MSEPTSDVTNTACELMSEEEYAELEHIAAENAVGWHHPGGGGRRAPFISDDDATANYMWEHLRAERTARLNAEEERDLLRDVARAAEYARDEVAAGHFTSFQFEQYVCAALDRAKKGGALPER